VKRAVILSNLHTHTTWCDGKNTPREMIETALSLGYHTIGFSGHSHTPFDLSFCMRDELGYASEILSLKKEYEGRIHVVLGVEWDALGQVSFEPEYRIGAVHYVSIKGEHIPIDHTVDLQRKLIDECFGGSAMDAVKAYFESLPEMAYQLKPDLIAHFDVFAKFNKLHPAFDEESQEYLDAAFRAVEGVMESCTRFEVNTGGMYRGYRQTPYPALPILEHIRKCGGEVVISTDAHKTDALDFGMGHAAQLLFKVGFPFVWQFTPKGWVKTPIADALAGYEL
jgi:histidinol-phosphatase (PHP family)